MKRMAVFIFYDFQGIVDEYVKYLMRSLMSVVERIVIVSNIGLNKENKRELEIFTEYIYERENRGFDAGAYKDTFTFYLKDELFENWDEVLLLNDTFYGPIYPWQEMFSIMDSQNVDFWGMTKQECYKLGDGTKLLPHVQSYFIAIRKRMLSSVWFSKFWENMEYPEVLIDAVLNFEVKFTNFFLEKGFNYTTYTDVRGCDFLINKSELTYRYYISELLASSRLPIIKRKALTITNFEKAQSALEYVSACTDYDVNLIKNHMSRLDVNHKLEPFGYIELDDFCARFTKVYIYGKGKIGNLVETYFRCKGVKFEGYIVTEKKEINGDNVISYSDFYMDNDVGIILALNKKNTEEVLSKIVCNVPVANLLIPNYQIDLSNYIS